MTENERICLCAMNNVFGFEPAIAHKILDVLGSASALFGLSDSDKDELFGPFSKYKSRICTAELDMAAEEMLKMKRLGIRMITVTEDSFPALLKECPDSPVALYLRSESSETDIFGDRPFVAVVGTRNPSLYGREWCRRIITALASSRLKPCIVSGLAIGTDFCAHSTAIEAGLPSIAVLPSGLDSVYPMRHRAFADMMASTPGCALVSDYSIGTGAAKINFVRRNRIIAGLCKATILTESSIHGGGMITARFTSSYDRDLYVLPGRIDDPLSQGCNLLLRERLAEAITDPDILVEALGLGKSSRRRKEDLLSEVSEFYRASPYLPAIRELAMAIRNHRGIGFEGLAAMLERPYSEISALCTMLESDGFITTDILQRCSIKVKIT